MAKGVSKAGSPSTQGVLTVGKTEKNYPPGNSKRSHDTMLCAAAVTLRSPRLLERRASQYFALTSVSVRDKGGKERDGTGRGHGENKFRRKG